MFRMVVFFVVMDIILSGLLTVTGFMNTSHTEDLYKTDVKERRSNFIKSLDDKSALTRAMVADYSVWDDTYDYLLGKLPGYPELNITEDSLGTFRSDAMWLYKSNFSLATSFATFDDVPNFAAQKQKIQHILDTKKSIHFYVKANNGLLEVFGATVVRSDDYAHEKKPAGYLFIGRQITNENLAELQDSYTTSVKLLAPKELNTYPAKLPARAGVLIFNVECNDLNNTPLGYIHVMYRDDALHQLDRLSTILIWMNSLTFLALILAVYTAAHKWVVKPVRIIYNGLEKADTSGLKELLRQETEFGKMALLIDRFFEQQDILKKEMQEKAVVLNELETQSKELARTNNSMIGRELKMIELKEELKALKSKRGDKK